MSLHRSLFTALILALAANVGRAATDEEAAIGRRILQDNADAIVSVELVVTAAAGRGRGAQEQQREINATVISPEGLTVTSLAAIDPRVTSGRGADTSETEFKEVKIRLADNTEIPARVVLKDADLDLAFIAPVPDPILPPRTFEFVDLENAGAPEILGTYYDMTRLGKTMQRTPVIQTVTVIGLVERPRRIILTNDLTLGCPVFDKEGRPLGISLVYLANNAAVQLVVVPAADVLEIANQAKRGLSSQPAPAGL